MTLGPKSSDTALAYANYIKDYYLFEKNWLSIINQYAIYLKNSMFKMRDVVNRN